MFDVITLLQIAAKPCGLACRETGRSPRKPFDSAGAAPHNLSLQSRSGADLWPELHYL
jgi:hypothetical protein